MPSQSIIAEKLSSLKYGVLTTERFTYKTDALSFYYALMNKYQDKLIELSHAIDVLQDQYMVTYHLPESQRPADTEDVIDTSIELVPSNLSVEDMCAEIYRLANWRMSEPINQATLTRIQMLATEISQRAAKCVTSIEQWLERLK